MPTEFLPYVDRLNPDEFQAVVLIHDMPERGRPSLRREAVGELQGTPSSAMRLAMSHAASLGSEIAGAG